MKFAQSSFVYWNFPLQEAIKRLHAAGYQGVEIWGGRPHYYRRDLDGEINQIRKLLDSLEMEVPNFIPAQFRYPSQLCSLNEKIRKDSVDYIKDAVFTAELLDCKKVSLCPGLTLFGEKIEEGWNALKQSIVELLDFTEVTGTLLLVEPAHKYETTLIYTVEDCKRMIKEIGSDRVGILADTGHLHVNGEPVYETISSLKDHSFHIHIDDNNGDFDSHIIPGKGTFDWAGLKKALIELNYQGFVSAELGFQYTLIPDEAVKETMDFLKKW